MRKRTLQKQLSTAKSSGAAAVEELERKLADKEAVLDMYRSLYNELLDRFDTLNGIVHKKLVAAPAKLTAPKATVKPRK